MNRAWHIPVLLGVALAVQLAFLLAVGDAPLNADEAEYATTARRLAAGHGLTLPGGQLNVHRHPPLYPLFLAGIFAAGGGVGAARVVQAGLAVVALAFVYFSSREALGPKLGARALLLGALYLPLAYYSTKLLTEVLFAAALAAALYLTLRALGRGRAAYASAVVAGAAFGAAALVRSIALPAAAAVALYLALAREGDGRRRLARAGTFLAGLAVVVGAWSAYVFSRTGRLVLTDTNGAAVLYMGNNPRAPYYHSWEVLRDPEGSAPLLEVAGRGADGFEVATSYRREALAYMVAHPAATAARAAGRLLDLLEPERLFAATFAAGRLPKMPPALAWPLAAAVVVVDAGALLLGGAGLALLPRGRLRDLLLVVAGVFVVLHALTLAYPRYHVPLVVISLAGAAYALSAEGLGALRRRPPRWGHLVGLGLFAFAAAASWLRLAVLYLHGRP